MSRRTATLVERCYQLGLRVVVGLVVQHTSIDHPWFRSARDDPASPYREFYLWAAEPHADEVVAEPVFAGVEDSIWAYDDHAGKYYRHAFYYHQPDLDVGRPEVRAEIAAVVRYWLDHGVDGFRFLSELRAECGGWWLRLSLVAREVDGGRGGYTGRERADHASVA